MNRALETAKAAADKSSEMKTEFLVHLSNEVHKCLGSVLERFELESDTRHDALADSVLSASHRLMTSFDQVLDLTMVEAGRYDITWEQHSPDVTVTFAKGKEVIVTAKGRMESRSTKYQRNMIVYTTQPDGSQTINELRIGGTSSAIVFNE